MGNDYKTLELLLDSEKRAEEAFKKIKTFKLQKCLEFLKSNYLDFLNDYYLLLEESYHKSLKKFDISAEEFFKYLKGLELTDQELCILADLYEMGIGTTPNKDLAKEYYQKSIKHSNYPPALHGLAFLQGFKNSFELLSQLANSNLSDAIYQLARCYKHGWGTAPDYSKSLDLYVKAIKMGNPFAKKEFGRLIDLVVNHAECDHFDCSKKIEFLLKATAHGFNVTNELESLLTQIVECPKVGSVYECYTIVASLGITCPDKIMAKVNIVLEELMDSLRRQAARSLGISLNKSSTQFSIELT